MADSTMAVAPWLFKRWRMKLAIDVIGAVLLLIVARIGLPRITPASP